MFTIINTANITAAIGVLPQLLAVIRTFITDRVDCSVLLQLWHLICHVYSNIIDSANIIAAIGVLPQLLAVIRTFNTDRVDCSV